VQNWSRAWWMGLIFVVEFICDFGVICSVRFQFQIIGEAIDL
jgi:hypothetical protein